MLGRDLINYIIQNNLLDTPLFENGKMLGFMSDEEAGAKFGVGASTVRVWINQGKLEGIRVNGTVYIPYNSKDPRSPEEVVPAIG